MEDTATSSHATAAASPVQPDTCSAAILRRLAKPGVAGLYLHIPFCFHKCHYCDFYSLVDTHDRQAAFVERMIGEMHAVSPLISGQVRTIFVGGGTPTLLKPPLWQTLLKSLHEQFDLAALSEFTVEANPETVTPELMDVLASGGVNRVSIGGQTFNERHLKTLERWHDPRKVGEAVEMCRAAGIDNVNVDLIFAIPGQTLAEWQADLERVLELGTTHLSCYSLMFEPNTPLTKKLQMGVIDRADEDVEAAMFETTIDTLASAGFEHYEVSNFARRDARPRKSNRCEHNLLYWQNENWLSIGPSGSAHVNGVRWKNVPHLGKYLASPAADGCPVQDVEQLDADASFGEQLMLRLRLLDGVELTWLEPRLDPRRRAAIEQQTSLGLLERTANALRLTRRGLMLCDSVVGELL
jgi:oxygen-independent coproporphyrinogen-3 oxidase